jgi:ribosomal protein L4
MVVTENLNGEAIRAMANDQNADIETAELLSTYDVVANNRIVITKGAVKLLEEAYKE